MLQFKLALFMEKLQYFTVVLRCPLLTVLCNNKSFLTQNTLLFFIHLRGKRARRTGTCLACTAHNPHSTTAPGLHCCLNFR